MSEVGRVPGPGSPLEGRSAKILAVVAAGIIVAILKPWGTAAPVPAIPERATPSPSGAPAAVSSADRLRNYDPDVFGLYEPTPGWELWPAGFLVSFGFSTRIGSLTVGSDAPSAPPDGTLPPASPAVPGPRGPTASRVAGGDSGGEPVWPGTITVSSGTHLSMLGINTPLGYRVADVAVALREPTGGLTRVPSVRPPSPWPLHFTIVAMGDSNGRDLRDSWPPGEYLIDLEFEPGPIWRRVVIFVGGPENATAPSPSVSAAATPGS